MDIAFFSRPDPLKFFKDCLHKIYLVHSWILYVNFKTRWKGQRFIFYLMYHCLWQNKRTNLNWLCKHMKKAKNSQVSFSINSCTELSKTQFFLVSIVKSGYYVEFVGYLKSHEIFFYYISVNQHFWRVV